MARAGGLPLPTITDDRALGAADIQRSFRFNNDSSTHLERTFGTNSSDTTKTLSFWMKRGNISSYQIPFGTTVSGNIEGYIRINNDDTLQLEDRNADDGTSDCRRITSAKLRDPSAWYHIVLALDSTQGTEADRAKFYINGTQATISSSISIVHNYSFQFFRSSVINKIGVNGNDQNFFDGYLAEIHFVDGYQYDSSYFGFTDPQTGIWMPKRYEGTYGNNGFYLDFSDNSSITNMMIDKSPNGNDWSPDNCNTEDSMLDTPTNIFPTWNPVSTVNVPDIQEGNLKNMGTNNTACNATFGVTSGKWYWEQYCLTDISSSSSITTAGVTKYETENDGDVEPRLGYTVGRSFYRGGSTGGYYNYKNYNQTSSTEVNSGGTYWGGAVVSFRLDMDAGTLKYYTNNTLVHTDSTIPTDGTRIFPMNSNTNSGVSRYNSIVSNFGQDSSFAGNKTAQGNTDENGVGDFYYAVPSGFRALCSRNLPVETSIIRPKKHFDIILYTGDEATSRKISGLEFKPDFVWIKPRSTTSNHVVLDSVRGVHNRMLPNSSNGNVNNTSTITAFNVDGFQIGNSSLLNTDGATHVAWCWKAGGDSNTFNVDDVGYASASAAGITDGSIALTAASVNREAGFSIVTYTGTGSSGTVGHGFTKTPKVVMTKSRSASGSWNLLHTVGNPTAEYGLFLNDNGGHSSYQGGTHWGDTLPTSTVFTVNSNASTNASGVTYVAYCWAEIPGYSKFGIYEATNNTDGPYVHLGFQPKWVMMKPVDSAGNWQIYDTTRTPINKDNGNALYPDLSNSEATGFTMFDFLSTGFKNRNSGSGGINYSGTYIYMAFAEQPGTTPFDTFPNAR